LSCGPWSPPHREVSSRSPIELWKRVPTLAPKLQDVFDRSNAVCAHSVVQSVEQRATLTGRRYAACGRRSPDRGDVVVSTRCFTARMCAGASRTREPCRAGAASTAGRRHLPHTAIGTCAFAALWIACDQLEHAGCSGRRGATRLVGAVDRQRVLDESLCRSTGIEARQEAPIDSTARDSIMPPTARRVEGMPCSRSDSSAARSSRALVDLATERASDQDAHVAVVRAAGSAQLREEEARSARQKRTARRPSADSARRARVRQPSLVLSAPVERPDHHGLPRVRGDAPVARTARLRRESGRLRNRTRSGTAHAVRAAPAPARVSEARCWWTRRGSRRAYRRFKRSASASALELELVCFSRYSRAPPGPD